MKLKMQPFAGSARLFKTWKQSCGLFLILTYQRTWTPQASLFKAEAATLFFLLKTLKLHMPETVWNFRKEWTALLPQPKKWRSVHVSTSCATQHCSWHRFKKKEKKNHNPRNGPPSPCLFLKLWGRQGEQWLPSPFPAMLSPLISSGHPAATSPCRRHFFGGRSNHTPESYCGHISTGSNATEAVTACSGEQQEYEIWNIWQLGCELCDVNRHLSYFSLVRWRKLVKLPNYMRQQGSKIWLKGNCFLYRLPRLWFHF